jgi:hypothetical protein
LVFEPQPRGGATPRRRWVPRRSRRDLTRRDAPRRIRIESAIGNLWPPAAAVNRSLKDLRYFKLTVLCGALLESVGA